MVPGLMALALGVAGVFPAWAARADPGAAQTPNRPARSRGRRAGLEERVATLTRALALDEKQQATLRKVLQGQREQALRIWNDESRPSASRVAATRELSRHTADQIRALLSEEQRKRYDPPPERDATNAVRSAQVEDWMKGGKVN